MIIDEHEKLEKNTRTLSAMFATLGQIAAVLFCSISNVLGIPHYFSVIFLLILMFSIFMNM